MPPKKRTVTENGTGWEVNRIVCDEPEEQTFTVKQEMTETEIEQVHEPEAEDEDEYPALQRIVEFYETHPYFYNLKHDKYRNTELKEAELAELAAEIKWSGE